MFPARAYSISAQPPTKASRVAELQGHITRLVHFADTLEKFALLFQPNHGETVHELREAWLQLQTTPLLEAIEDIQNEPNWEPPAPTPETLINLVDARDKIQGQIDSLEAAKEKMSEHAPGVGEMMAATVVPMLQHQLETLNQQISYVQGQLEKPAAP